MAPAGLARETDASMTPEFEAGFEPAGKACASTCILILDGIYIFWVRQGGFMGSSKF